jgi:hypothetical protein
MKSINTCGQNVLSARTHYTTVLQGPVVICRPQWESSACQFSTDMLPSQFSRFYSYYLTTNSPSLNWTRDGRLESEIVEVQPPDIWPWQTIEVTTSVHFCTMCDNFNDSQRSMEIAKQVISETRPTSIHKVSRSYLCRRSGCHHYFVAFLVPSYGRWDKKQKQAYPTNRNPPRIAIHDKLRPYIDDGGNHLRIQVPNSLFIMMSYQDLEDDELFLQSSSESAREILLGVIDGWIKLQCSFLNNYRRCLLETRPRANTGNYR